MCALAGEWIMMNDDCKLWHQYTCTHIQDTCIQTPHTHTHTQHTHTNTQTHTTQTNTRHMFTRDIHTHMLTQRKTSRWASVKGRRSLSAHIFITVRYFCMHYRHVLDTSCSALRHAQNRLLSYSARLDRWSMLDKSKRNGADLRWSVGPDWLARWFGTSVMVEWIH